MEMKIPVLYLEKIGSKDRKMHQMEQLGYMGKQQEGRQGLAQPA